MPFLLSPPWRTMLHHPSRRGGQALQRRGNAIYLRAFRKLFNTKFLWTLLIFFSPARGRAGPQRRVNLKEKKSRITPEPYSGQGSGQAPV